MLYNKKCIITPRILQCIRNHWRGTYYSITFLYWWSLQSQVHNATEAQHNSSVPLCRIDKLNVLHTRTLIIIFHVIYRIFTSLKPVSLIEHTFLWKSHPNKPHREWPPVNSSDLIFVWGIHLLSKLCSIKMSDKKEVNSLATFATNKEMHLTGSIITRSIW